MPSGVVATDRAGLGVVAGRSLWRGRIAINALSEDENEIGEALSGR